MLMRVFTSLLLLSNCNFSVNAQGTANFIIEKSYACEDVPHQIVTLIMKPKTFTRPQVLDLTLITPMPIGNQLKYVAKVDLENRFLGKNWQHLFTIEDDFCRAMQVYFGRLAYDMETAMGIVPRGVCPIPKGKYHAVNYTVDFNTLKLQALPFGRFRATFKYIEKSNKNTVLCSVLIMSNIQ